MADPVAARPAGDPRGVEFRRLERPRRAPYFHGLFPAAKLAGRL